MKLNSKNIFARYYNWIYDELPNDVCTFFWATLFSIVFTIILIPGRLLSEPYDDFSKKFGHGFLFWLLSAFVTLIGTLPFVVLNFRLHMIINVFAAIFIYFLTGVVVVLLIVGIVFGIKWIIEKSKDNIINSSDESIYYKTRNFIGAIRGKYCTKIEWVRK